jgi:hypothetical protein
MDAERQSQARATLLVRPAEPKRRLRLEADPLALARLAAASARCRVPVDVGASLALELVHRGGEEPEVLWRAAASLGTLPDRPDPTLAGWLSQLRRGTGFTEEELPYVWVPLRVEALAPELTEAALACAAREPWLRAALDLECAAARTGLTAAAALESLPALSW